MKNITCSVRPSEDGTIIFKGIHFSPTGYDKYYASRCGRLLSCVMRTPRIMRPNPNSAGYVTTNILTENGRRLITVSRLVAKAFCPNPDNKPEVNHINGIKSDNRAENLEWCTREENMAHAIRTGLSPIGSERSNAVLNENAVHAIKFLLSIGMKKKTIAGAFLVSSNMIANIGHEKRWKHVSLGYVDTTDMF